MAQSEPPTSEIGAAADDDARQGRPGRPRGKGATSFGGVGRIWRIVFDASMRFNDNAGLVVAGSIAFTALFSLFPFLIFLVTVGSVLGQADAAREFVELALDAMPPEVAGALRPAIEEVLETPRTGLMTVSILVALWVASSAIESLRHAVNVAFGTENPLAIWWARLQSLALTIFFAFAILMVMLAVVAGPLIWSFLERTFRIPVEVGWLYEVARYLIGILILFSSTSLLYRLLASQRLHKREVVPGALIVVVLWMATASLFSLYLANFANYTVTYGSLGGLVLTMMFFYLSAAIFVLGAEVNAAVKRHMRA